MASIQSPFEFEVGTIVRTNEGDDGIVCGTVERGVRGYGVWEAYTVMIFDSGVTQTFNKHELTPLTYLQEEQEVDWTDDIFDLPEPEEPPVEKKTQFAVIDDDKQVEDLAENRLSKATK